VLDARVSQAFNKTHLGRCRYEIRLILQAVSSTHLDDSDFLGKLTQVSDPGYSAIHHQTR